MILANYGIIASSGASSTLSLGLVSAYKAENNVSDSLSTYNGTAYGGLTYTIGKSGNAFNFNGTTSYADLGDTFDLGTSSWSYSMWFNASSFATYTSLFSKAISGSSVGRISVYYNASKLVFNFQTDASTNAFVENNTTLTTNTWYHAVFVVDRTDKLKIYLNGTLQTGNSGSNNLTSYSSVNYNTNHPFRIGCYTAIDNTTPSFFYSGKIDEVGIWNRALSQSEITELQTKYYPF
jgi:hypothetical protein